jgi:hypothetical protein
MIFKKNPTIIYFILIIKNSDNEWKNLNDYLENLKTLPNIFSNFEDDKRLQHYFERIYFHTNRSLNREYCINVLNKITDLFPKVVFIFNKQ